MAVKISHYRKNPKESNVKSFINVHIEELDLHICGLREIETHEGKRFFSFPSKEYTDKEGKTKYQPICYFGKEKNEKFQAALRMALHAFKIANNLE